MTHQHLSDSPVEAQSYGLLFPALPALDCDESFIQRLGNIGGPCDGSDVADPDGAREAAGWPFFGQYVAHDITADRSTLALHADIEALRNARRQKLDLEGLYGAGPAGEPFYYDVRDSRKLLLGDRDLQRNTQGTAIIGDPRNDSHLFVSQLHLLFARFHNAVVDWVSDEQFATAQQLVRWHYQWIVLHDFLPRLIGAPLAAELIESGPTYYNPMHEPYVPLEFAAGAYRYGHGQIRDRYRVNATAPAAPMFPDFIGFRPVEPAHVIDWAYLFDLKGCPPAQRARKIDGRLPRSLMRLPEAISGAVATSAYRALSVRDLQRGQACGLASGEAIARHLGLEPLTRDEAGLASMGWSGETPLWYYVLREAAVRANGDQLGPVGARIVGEVLTGLLDHDPESFRMANPTWKPVLPSASAGEFSLADLVMFVSRSGSR
jgi:Animal haem peroxidase